MSKFDQQIEARKTATLTMRENILQTLVKEIHATARKKGWWDQRREFLELLMLVVTEVGEAAEMYRQNCGLQKIFFDENGKPEGIPIELADVIIRTMDLAEGYGLPLVKAIELKLEYNKTRPYRHGNKKA